jgi:hypothetical protein
LIVGVFLWDGEKVENRRFTCDHYSSLWQIDRSTRAGAIDKSIASFSVVTASHSPLKAVINVFI